MFQQAKRLNKISLYLVQLAIVVFLIAGTCASLPKFHASNQLALGLHYAPFALVTLSIPFTLYCGFLLLRLNLLTARTFLSMVTVAMLLFLCGTYFGMAAWLGMPWVLKWAIAAFDKFLLSQTANLPHS